jgi:hypothetical protein
MSSDPGSVSNPVLGEHFDGVWVENRTGAELRPPGIPGEKPHEH